MPSHPQLAHLDGLLDDPRLAGSAAAFDADGTLWAGDVGELILQAMIGLGQAPHDAIQIYEDLLSRDAPAACAYCVELLRGTSLDALEAWSRELVKTQLHGPLYDPVVGLAQALASRGCEVWVVSGSNRWTVEVAVDAAGLDPRRVLALSCPVKNKQLTGEVDRPLTCAEGKVTALRAATSKPLIFAAGNALYDLALLDHAERQLVVAPRGAPTPLRAVASARGWPVLDVR